VKNDLDKIEFPKILVVSNNCLVIQIKMVRHWHHFLRQRGLFCSSKNGLEFTKATFTF
jgi:hypothetical protein